MMNEKIKFIFMLGRPGCGKSYLYNNVFVPVFKKKGITEIERLDDFPVLQELLDKDTGFKRHIRADGGFQVTDWTIVDDVLKEMDKMLKAKEKNGKIILVEFARDNYRKAFKNFSNYVRLRSLLIYIWASLDVCLESNKKRFEKKNDVDSVEYGKSSNGADNHIVPEALMNTYYKTDDIEQVFLKNKNRFPSGILNWELKIFNNSNRDMNPGKKEKIFFKLIEEYRL